MATILTQLNGWQRLWVVFSIIALALATILVVINHNALRAVEDEKIVAKANAEYDRIIVMRRGIEDPKFKSPAPPTGFVEMPLSIDELYHEHEFRDLSSSNNEQSTNEGKVDDIELLRLRAQAKARLERTREAEGLKDSFIPDKPDRYPSDTKVDTIQFPNDMQYAEIKDLIYKWYGINPDTITTLAANLIRERNNRQVAEARTKNNEIRSANTRFILYAYLGWLILVSSVYMFGYGIGWIYHGFKKS